MRHRKTWASRYIVAAIAVVASLAVLGVACGGDDDDGNGGDPTRESTAGSNRPSTSPTEGAASTPTAGTTPAAGADTTVLIRETDIGEVLTDEDGLTLYTFDNDTAGSGESACVDACVNAWPPATLTGEPTGPDALTGELGTIERPEGSTQVTYNGLPLYRFASDTAPGETKGEGVGGVWDAARP